MLLYADDALLSEEERQDLTLLTQQLKTRLDEYGLQLNIKKMDYMECDPQTDDTIQVDGQDRNKVIQFKYLGLLIYSDSDSLPDAWTRVNTT